MRAASLARKGAPVAAGASALALAAVVVSGALAAPAARAAPAAHAAAKPVVVSFGEFFYRPATVTVKVGQKLIFRNAGTIAHTVADADAKGEIRSTLIKPRSLDPGQSQTVSFAKPGVVTYLCTFHPTLMRGRILVTR